MLPTDRKQVMQKVTILMVTMIVQMIRMKRILNTPSVTDSRVDIKARRKMYGC